MSEAMTREAPRRAAKKRRCRECLDPLPPYEGRGRPAVLCGECAAPEIYQRRYRASNREKLAEQKRRYYASNREKVADYQRRYRASNREKRKIRRRKKS